MAFPLNPTINDLYTAPTGVVYRYMGNYWEAHISASPSTTNNTPDIINTNQPNMTIISGSVTGLPYIQVNSVPERVILQSELDGTNYSSIDINAGYF